MSRHKSSASYGHACHPVGGGLFRISWVVDFYYLTSRLRHPRRFHRDVDDAGARRFCKKWQLPQPREAAK